VIGRISASAGASLFSWGENLTIVVQRAGEQNTDVIFDSALKVGFNAAGASRHHKNFERIIAALSKHLAAPSGTPAGSSGRFKSREEYERWKATLAKGGRS
jgi:hypothetical protein